MEWTEFKNKKPKTGIPVLACGINSCGKIRRLRACYIPENFMENDDDSFLGELGEDCYNEEKDMYYWPEGWYEWNENEEIHWLIDFEITHWMFLLEAPYALYNKH
jgi:hypothetical protein